MFLRWFPHLSDWLLGSGRLAVDLIVGLAWPAVVLTIVLIFRKPLHRFISEAREMSGWGASIKRGDAAATVALAQSLESEVAAPPTIVQQAAGSAEAKSASSGDVALDSEDVRPLLRLSFTEESRLLSVVHGALEGSSYDGQFDQVMAAGQAVWDALRTIGGGHLALPGSATEMRHQLRTFGLPISVLETLESIVDVYNGVVIRNTLRLSSDGMTSYAAACTNAIKQLGRISRGSTGEAPAEDAAG